MRWETRAISRTAKPHQVRNAALMLDASARLLRALSAAEGLTPAVRNHLDDLGGDVEAVRHKLLDELEAFAEIDQDYERDRRRRRRK